MTLGGRRPGGRTIIWRLEAALPEIPDDLNDRAQDNWEPLLAIADLAAGDWPNTARPAAKALSKEAEGEG